MGLFHGINFAGGSVGYIPSSVMIPPRRFDVLLEQAREFQRRSCEYHNTSEPFSLYTNHSCGRESFPGVTTLILAEHEDEVWDLQWSHNGCYLATASSDQTAIIWRIGVSRLVFRV
jgi:WD repeat-containing protein 26